MSNWQIALFVLAGVYGWGRIILTLFRVARNKKRLKPVTWRACWKIEWLDHYWNWGSRA